MKEENLGESVDQGLLDAVEEQPGTVGWLNPKTGKWEPKPMQSSTALSAGEPQAVTKIKSWLKSRNK